jgi:hypothetical protein
VNGTDNRNGKKEEIYSVVSVDGEIEINLKTNARKLKLT